MLFPLDIRTFDNLTMPRVKSISATMTPMRIQVEGFL